jgi:ADP-ribosylglycohydrolase
VRVNLYAAAVAAFAEAASLIAHPDSQDALQMAVTCSNCTGIIAAIAGALLGAVSGASAVSQRLRQHASG